MMKGELHRHANIHQKINCNVPFVKETNKRKRDNKPFDSQKKRKSEMIVSDTSQTIVITNLLSDNSDESYVTKYNIIHLYVRN